MLKTIRDWLITIFEAILLTILLILFVAQSFLVEGYSMEPTLHNGERVLVEKLSYRLRKPKRGEIVIIQNPLQKKEKYIKRIFNFNKIP
ncbi:MAG TPA: signal peptidase I, partial [Firmicutes bacterium]|nr:signal peptidase I [Bacillota bacterium]